MLGLIDQLHQTSFLSLIVAGFTVGLFSTFHCVGMCGPLIVASTKSKFDLFRYSIGRYVGYSFLAVFCSSFSFGLTLNNNKIVSVLVAIGIGGSLILFGLKSIYPKWGLNLAPLNGLHQGLIRNWRISKVFGKSTIIGFASSFLPCGLLWGVIIALMALPNPLYAWVGVTAFFTGTLPGLLTSPLLLQRFFPILQKRAPTLFGVFFIGLGIFALVVKLYPLMQPQGPHCH